MHHTMGPSVRRRTTRKSASRRRALFKKPQQGSNKISNQENSVASRVSNSPVKPSNESKADKAKDLEGADASGDCSTPKAERFRIPEINTCPPAPRKRRLVTSCSLRRTAPVAFFAPPDIELFFYFALRGIRV